MFLAAVFALPCSAHAALVTLTGTDIQVTYDTVADAAALSLFGAPSLSGDVLSFLPTTFTATSNNTTGNVLTTATFDLTIQGINGF